MTNDPFCHVFTWNGDHYVYDVNTSEVFAVDVATAAMLGAAIPDVSATRLAAARRDLEIAQERDGLFLPHRPTTITGCRSCHGPDAYDGLVQQLTLSVSEQCNLRCRYCLHGNALDWVRPHRDTGMSRETAFAAVREFLRRSRDAVSPSISFYGGEPLLELDLIREVVELVRRESLRDDYQFIVDTNGTRLDAETVDFLVAERFDLQVSLDGPPEIHDRHRRFRDGGPSHAEICAGLARLFAADPRAHERVRYQVTLAPPSDPVAVGAWFGAFPLHRAAGIDEPPHVGVGVANLEGMDLEQLGLTRDDLDRFRQSFVLARRRYVDTCVAEGHDAVDPVLSALFDDGLISFYHRDRRDLGDAVSPAACCRPGQRRLHVCADGRYQPCERVGDGLIIGHAETGLDLEAVDRLWARFVRALDDRCLDCWAKRHCPLCFTEIAGLEDGEGVPEDVCDAARRRVELKLAMWVEMSRRDPASLEFLRTSTVS